MKIHSKPFRFLPAFLLSLLIIAVSGYVYRVCAEKLDALTQSPLLPDKPLETFPKVIGGWQGFELPLSEAVLSVAGNEDYISRRYRNEQTGAEVTFYLAYTSQPRNMLGHRPRVCYTNSGWGHETTEIIEIQPIGEPPLDCLIHQFFKTENPALRITVLNYYILNGRFTTDHNLFSGLRYRSFRQTRKNPRYVAQIQISSRSQQSAISFGELIAPRIMPYMPEISP